MFVSDLWLEGVEYNAKSAARRLKLGREAYVLAGTPIKLGPRKGTPRETSVLRIPLSRRVEREPHLQQVEKRLEDLMTFINSEPAQVERRHQSHTK